MNRTYDPSEYIDYYEMPDNTVYFQHLSHGRCNMRFLQASWQAWRYYPQEDRWERFSSKRDTEFKAAESAPRDFLLMTLRAQPVPER